MSENSTITNIHSQSLGKKAYNLEVKRCLLVLVMLRQLLLSADSRNPPANALVSAARGASFLSDDVLNAAQHASLQSTEVLSVTGCVCASIVRYTLSETKLKNCFYLPLEPFSNVSGEINPVCPGLGDTRKPICSLRPVSFMFFCL